MNKQRKICGAILALAGSAFGVDRWMGGSGSADAVAGAAGQVTLSGSVKAGRAKEGAEGAEKAAKPLAVRLAEAARAEQLRASDVADAFRPSPLWLPEPVAATAKPAPQIEAPKIDPVAEFRARHRLTAVMKAGRSGSGLAMIDGRTLTPGQAVDGFTLVSVRERSAVLQSADVSMEMSIEMPADLSSQAGAAQ